jgi:hypothetical protein
MPVPAVLPVFGTVLMADNYLSKTRDNMLNNGKIAFVVLDKEK